MKMFKVKNKESVSGEIIRFAITGVVSGLGDFGLYTLTSVILKKIGLDPKSVWMTIICTIIGFIIGVTINYFMSVYWVFQNVDKEKQKENKNQKIIIFVLLSAIGLLISIGIMALCKFIFQTACNINIDTWWDIKYSGLFKWIGAVLSSLAFWLYAVSFVLKTIGGMIFNYITRKKILFKKPAEKAQKIK